MKRVKSNYHALQVLRTAEPKLRKAILSNCNKELVNSINECIPNVLNGNVKLTGCYTRKLRKHKPHFRRRPTCAFLPAIASLFLEIMLRKMYLVSAETFSRKPRIKPPPLLSAKKASKNSPHSPFSKKNKEKTRKREKQPPQRQMG